MTCRQRKLKCDEQKPVCGQCTKGNRHCQPSGGLTFRHQHNASMNASRGSSPTTRNASLSSFYSYKNTFDADTIWCDVPRQRKYPGETIRSRDADITSVTFFHTANPYLDPGTPENDGQLPLPHQTPYAQQHQSQWNPDQQYDMRPELHPYGLEALSAAALHPPEANMLRRRMSQHSNQFDHQIDPSPPVDRDDRHSTSPRAEMSSSNNLNFLLNPASANDTPIDPSLRSPAVDHTSLSVETLQSPKIVHGKLADGEAESEQKVAHLLRHFSESPGQWRAG